MHLTLVKEGATLNKEENKVIGENDEDVYDKIPKKNYNVLKISKEIGINKSDLINSFEDIGWFDPEIDPKQAS